MYILFCDSIDQGQWLASHTDELPEHSMTPSVRRVNDLKKVNSGNTSNPLTCTCIPGYVYNEATKQCYREFTQGPCLKRHFFIGSSNNDIGICKLNPCSPRQLYFPEKRKCFNIHTAGPCSNGQLVIGYDPNGIGYRGRCGCSALNTPFYWQPDGKCYPHESRGVNNLGKYHFIQVEFHFKISCIGQWSRARRAWSFQRGCPANWSRCASARKSTSSTTPPDAATGSSRKVRASGTSGWCRDWLTTTSRRQRRYNRPKWRRRVSANPDTNTRQDRIFANHPAWNCCCRCRIPPSSSSSSKNRHNNQIDCYKTLYIYCETIAFCCCSFL